LIQTVIIILVS